MANHFSCADTDTYDWIGDPQIVVRYLGKLLSWVKSRFRGHTKHPLRGVETIASER